MREHRGHTSPSRDRLRNTLRVAILVLLAAAPLALGAVHEPAFVPLLVIGSTVGVVSWVRGHLVRAGGGDLPEVPGERALLALHGLVIAQLVPLPPMLLRLVSPGSFRFYDAVSLAPLTEWRPISVNPADTARGFAFLAGMSLLYAAVFREFRDRRWRRRLAGTVVATGFVMTLEALLQLASADPTKIYGLWKPMWAWGVFGPYVSRNHFAGYMAMAAAVSVGFTAEALVDLRHDWSRRGSRRWVALGGRSGNATVRRAAVTIVLLVGLLASQSRGGLLGLGAAFLALPLAFRGRRRAAVAVGLVVLLGLSLFWVDLGPIRRGFESRGIQNSRVALWKDSLRMFPSFPVLGSGLDTFGTAYEPYQTLSKYDWYGEVHNEYLQALLDLGIVGAALVLGLLLILLRAAFRSGSTGALDAGILGAILALCAHNLVDFNWQIPANAATFAALAGIAVRRGLEAVPAVDSATPAA